MLLDFTNYINQFCDGRNDCSQFMTNVSRCNEFYCFFLDLSSFSASLILCVYCLISAYILIYEYDAVINDSKNMR